MTHGGDLIAEVLARHGATHLFTLCGGHISPILTGAKARGIKVIDVRDEASAVFADIPSRVQEGVRAKGWRFYTFLGETGCRLMCAWDMTAERVDGFAQDLNQAADGR